MRRVFIVLESDKYNLDSAREIGEVKYLLTKKIGPFHTDVLARDLAKALKKNRFNPKEDYVCLTGPFVHTCVLTFVLGQKYREPIKFLIFDATSSSYKERTVA